MGNRNTNYTNYTNYEHANVVDNPNVGGLKEGRPWTTTP